MRALSKRLEALETRSGRGVVVVYEDSDGSLWHHHAWHPERRPVDEAEVDAWHRQRKIVVRVCYVEHWRDDAKGWSPDAA